ncbi:hypothetical protein QQ045_012817 [Rhodiola kirilowii]
MVDRDVIDDLRTKAEQVENMRLEYENTRAELKCRCAAALIKYPRSKEVLELDAYIREIEQRKFQVQTETQNEERTDEGMNSAEEGHAEKEVQIEDDDAEQATEEGVDKDIDEGKKMPRYIKGKLKI